MVTFPSMNGEFAPERQTDAVGEPDVGGALPAPAEAAAATGTGKCLNGEPVVNHRTPRLLRHAGLL